jgi:GT2 family glycosyltransferase
MATLETRIAYDVTGDLGGAYNRIMGATGADVVVLIDHDIFLCNPHWHHIISRIMTKHGDIGMLTCWAQRIGNAHHKDDTAPQCDDIAKHRKHARMRWDMHGYSVSAIGSCSGMLMAIRVECWREIGPFIGGFFNVDTDFSKRVAKHQKWQLCRANGLYVYHLRDRTEGAWIQSQPTSMSYLPK